MSILDGAIPSAYRWPDGSSVERINDDSDTWRVRTIHGELLKASRGKIHMRFRSAEHAAKTLAELGQGPSAL